MGKTVKIENGPTRKRGRPSGKNRVPLSVEERRARNAQYERERRAENAEAMAELAEAMGVDPTKMQGTELLDTVISYIEQDRESLDSLRSVNRKLEMQIKSCEERLNPAPVVKEEYLPETPSPEPDVDESMAAMNYPDALTSGSVHNDVEMYGYFNGVDVEESSPNTEEHIQTELVELDFDFLLDY